MNPIRIDGYELERVFYDPWPQLEIPIYEHQAAALEAYDRGENVLLTTKTGSGKTAAALFPLVRNGDNAIFVYPTNALIQNQLSSIYKTLISVLNLKVHISNYSLLDQDFETVSAPEADVCLYIITRDALESRGKHRGEIIQAILDAPSKVSLILTNPDTLFAILALCYREHLNVVRALNKYRAIVIDEFHMYYSVQLANVIFMLKFAEKLTPHAFQRKIFLSATPNEELEDLLEDLWKIKVPQLNQNYHKAESRTATYPLILKPFCSSDESNAGEIVRIVGGELKTQLVELRKKFPSQDYIPLVVIVNSVVEAIQIEEMILEKHPELIVSPYRGLMRKSERKIRDAHIVVGTSAIEVGIDFQCSFLIFEAGDASSFLQRFGRLGRHKIEEHDPEAYAFVPLHFYQYLSDEKQEFLSRNELEDIIKTHYKNYWSYTSFVWSDYGFIQAHVFIKKLDKLLRRWGEISEQAVQLMNDFIEELYEFFEIDEQRRKRVERKTKYKWFQAYLNSVSFRSNIPSVIVYDKAEERKGRIPFYETEVSTALAKGTPCLVLDNSVGVFLNVMKNFAKEPNIFIDSEIPMVLVDNYDYRYSLVFDTITEHQIFAPFVCEDTDLIVQRKRTNYHFSWLFNGHIAMYITSDVYALTDWRTKKFKTNHPGKYLVFDGDVLLYLSLVDKNDNIQYIRFKEKPIDQFL